MVSVGEKIHRIIIITFFLGLAERFARSRSLVQTPLKGAKVSAFQVYLGILKIILYKKFIVPHEENRYVKKYRYSSAKSR